MKPDKIDEIAGHDWAPYTDQESDLRLYLARRLKLSHEVDDYVQEVYLRVIALNDLDRSVIRDKRGFLRRVASNLLIDGFRRRRARMADDHVALDSVAEPIDDRAVDAERELIAKGRLNSVQQTLEGLDAASRRALVAVRIEGRSHMDVAAELGVPVKQVSRLIERALLALSRTMMDTE